MSVAPFSLPSFAKINLDLRIISRREDGYHELCTVFQSISLADRISFEAADELVLTCDDLGLPVDDNNIVIKAAKALRGRFGAAGARIHLEKNIPSPGGLGGGSSNAAITLIGLARLWQLEISTEAMAEIAAGLGADVPFFLSGGTMVGTGIGTTLFPIRDLECDTLVVVTPNIAISTAEAYRGVSVPSLTTDEVNRILLNYRFWAENVDFRSADLKNDFEETVFAANPEVERARSRLKELGAATALLSGSGASVFGIFDKQETRQTAMKALGNEANWRSFAVATISREQYREALGIVS